MTTSPIFSFFVRINAQEQFLIESMFSFVFFLEIFIVFFRVSCDILEHVF